MIHENIKELSTEQRHDLLLSTLDILHEGACWKAFMENVEILLPDNEKGRKNIHGSFVESLGFATWTDYINTSREGKGLGWSADGWNGYRRAWKTSKEFPWVLDSGMKPGTINAFLAKCKKLGIDMPAGIDEYNELKQQWKDDAAKAKEQPEQEIEPKVDGFPPKLTFWQWLTYWF